ncbi:calcineurin-like phosphoesterase [Aureococcus anophagefferens]|nr:calcineurin-like phosphoesterase [Aureococcus anophagefferens]
MGNHDLFLYLDATLDGSDPRRPMRMSVQAYPYSFFHPEEYAASPFTAKRDDDGEVLDALLESLLFVYETRATRKVLVPTPSRARPAGSVQPLRRRARFGTTRSRPVAGRLDEWRVDYAAGLRDSGLVDFLRARPVAAIAAASSAWPSTAVGRAADDDAPGRRLAARAATAAAVGGLASWWLGAGREKPRHRASDDPSDDGPLAEEPAAPDAPPDDGDAATSMPGRRSERRPS